MCCDIYRVFLVCTPQLQQSTLKCQFWLHCWRHCWPTNNTQVRGGTHSYLVRVKAFLHYTVCVCVCVCVRRLRAGKHVRPRGSRQSQSVKRDDSAKGRKQLAICVCPKLTVSRSCSWRPSVHAKCAHQSPPRPHSPLYFTTAAQPQQGTHVASERVFVKERKRGGVSGERSAVWPFLVATSNFVFSWPANVAARGRTDSERNGTGERARARERKCRRKHTKKKLRKSVKKSSR